MRMTSPSIDEQWLKERGYRIEGDRAVRIDQAPRVANAWTRYFDAAAAQLIESATDATQAQPAAQSTTAPRRPYWPYRSATEHRYAAHLVTQHLAGQCLDWWYEPIRLWLRPGMSYTPDFLVQTAGPDILSFTPGMPLTLTPAFAAAFSDYWRRYSLVFYEVKASQGHVYERSRAYDRLKIAAHLYPALTFKVSQWDRKRHDWQQRDITAT